MPGGAGEHPCLAGNGQWAAALIDVLKRPQRGVGWLEAEWSEGCAKPVFRRSEIQVE